MDLAAAAVTTGFWYGASTSGRLPPGCVHWPVTLPSFNVPAKEPLSVGTCSFRLVPSQLTPLTGGVLRSTGCPGNSAPPYRRRSASFSESELHGQRGCWHRRRACPARHRRVPARRGGAGLVGITCSSRPQAIASMSRKAFLSPHVHDLPPTHVVWRSTGSALAVFQDCSATVANATVAATTRRQHE